MPNALSRRNLLMAGQNLAFGAASLALFGKLAPVFARSSGTQHDWRFCSKCHLMFFDGYPNKGNCPAGGGHAAAGYNFRLSYDNSTPPRPAPNTQHAWRFCGKCHSLFFDGYSDKGRCPAGAGHAAAGYNFGLTHSSRASGAQPDWRFCQKCHALFFDGYAQKGRCPAGGGHVAAGYNFLMTHRAEAGPSAGPSNLTGVIQEVFNRLRPALEQAIKSELSRGDRIAKGVTLYNINLRLGQPNVRASSSNFELSLPGNHIYFKSTTPTALGKWADPALEVNFDLRMTGVMQPPSATTPRGAVRHAVVSVPHLRIKPRNVAAGVATTVAAIVRWFAKAATGRDIIQQTADRVLRRDVTSAINRQLSRR